MNEMTPADYAAINGSDGFMGGSGWWNLLLFLLIGGNGFGGGFDMPYFYNAQTQADVNRGFDNANINGMLNGINTAINCGFNDVALSQANQTANLMQSINNVGYGLADVKYTIANEGCATRNNSSMNTRDIIEAQNRNSQAILDKLCQQEIEQKNDLISQLRSELMYARGQASQDVQTAAIQAGQRALANEVEQYVLPTPRPAYIVSNPNCCPNTCACGV